MREIVSFIILEVLLYDYQAFFPKNFNMDTKKAKFYSCIVDNVFFKLRENSLGEC